MMGKSPFFTVHSDLPREGPGVPDDVRWALDVAGTPDRARICDAACGPGADTVTLAEERPQASIDAVDLQDQFVAAAKARTARFGTRVRIEQRDYSDLPGDYDLIWSAGAAYFVGYLKALEMWWHRLLPGGAIAFSEPVFVTDPPSAAVRTFWDPYDPAMTVPDVSRSLKAAGWQVVGERLIIGEPWKAYYDPMRERLAMLRASEPDEALLDAIIEDEEEIAQWEAAADEIAYGLFVVRPA